MTLVLLALLSLKPEASCVVWPRMDQKSCLKSISAAGLRPIVVENILEGDEIRTDVDAIAAAIEREGPENVLCVMSTSSCFTPRCPDRVPEIARLCAQFSDPPLFHVVNNAYGVQVSSMAEGGPSPAFVRVCDYRAH